MKIKIHFHSHSIDKKESLFRIEGVTYAEARAMWLHMKERYEDD